MKPVPYFVPGKNEITNGSIFGLRIFSFCTIIDISSPSPFRQNISHAAFSSWQHQILDPTWRNVPGVITRSCAPAAIKLLKIAAAEFPRRHPKYFGRVRTFLICSRQEKNVIGRKLFAKKCRARPSVANPLNVAGLPFEELFEETRAREWIAFLVPLVVNVAGADGMSFHFGM